jgi:hypothetical protein
MGGRDGLKSRMGKRITAKEWSSER